MAEHEPAEREGDDAGGQGALTHTELPAPPSADGLGPLREGDAPALRRYAVMLARGGPFVRAMARAVSRTARRLEDLAEWRRAFYAATHRDGDVVTPGMYRHWKGNDYRVLFTALDSNNDAHRETVVVYVSLSPSFAGNINIRRQTEFTEVITTPDGRVRRRFELRSALP